MGIRAFIPHETVLTLSKCMNRGITADIRKEGVIMREQLTKSDVEKIQEEIE